MLDFPNDYTPGGTKIVGAWENDRNAASRKVIHDVMALLYGKDVQTIIAHHLCYQIQDGDIFVVEEIPSMDAFLFDHEIAKQIWGEDYIDVLHTLVALPASERDATFASLFYSRHGS